MHAIQYPCITRKLLQLASGSNEESSCLTLDTHVCGGSRAPTGPGIRSAPGRGPLRRHAARGSFPSTSVPPCTQGTQVDVSINATRPNRVLPTVQKPLTHAYHPERPYTHMSTLCYERNCSCDTANDDDKDMENTPYFCNTAKMRCRKIRKTPLILEQRHILHTSTENSVAWSRRSHAGSLLSESCIAAISSGFLPNDCSSSLVWNTTGAGTRPTACCKRKAHQWDGGEMRYLQYVLIDVRPKARFARCCNG